VLTDNEKSINARALAQVEHRPMDGQRSMIEVSPEAGVEPMISRSPMAWKCDLRSLFFNVSSLAP
jgi:hypothetical protein